MTDPAYPLSVTDARRLLLARAGLLKPEWTGLPSRASGRGQRARSAALAVIGRFGYLQLDTVSVAGARSHALVLMARLAGLDPTLAEELLTPGAPLFEYWGHEASWLPLELYPAFEFRRRDFRTHPWWGDVIAQHPQLARRLKQRIRDEGPLRSVDMEGEGSRGWWDLKDSKRVAIALWSSGELAISERRNFQRSYDLAARVIPESLRSAPLARAAGLEQLALVGLDGHGFASAGMLAATWRLTRRRQDLDAALARLLARGEVVPAILTLSRGRTLKGYLRPRDLELVERLRSVRPRPDRGVLLSPFDPVLWDRARVQQLFGFDQLLEIYKPAAQRRYGYFCLPVLAGERLVARCDLAADRQQGVLRVLACHLEAAPGRAAARAVHGEATRTALTRHADALGLDLID